MLKFKQSYDKTPTSRLAVLAVALALALAIAGNALADEFGVEFAVNFPMKLKSQVLLLMLLIYLKFAAACDDTLLSCSCHAQQRSQVCCTRQ